VLVEKTVEDVIPLLKTNAEGLKKVLEDLVKTYKAKEGELEKWKVSLCAAPASLSLLQAICIGRRDANFPLQKKNNIQVVQTA
jgi:hypothetical protein